MSMRLPRPEAFPGQSAKAKTIGRPEASRRPSVREKVKAALDEAAVSDLGSFLHVFYRLGTRDRLQPNPLELGHLLAYLRETGKLSPEIDGFMADQLADAILHRLEDDLEPNKPLVPQIEQLALAEPADPDAQLTIFETYRTLAARARAIQGKMRLGQNTTEDEREALEDFKAFQFLVVDETPPATLVAHFLKTKDLGWLWGLDRKLDLRQFKLKTRDGKLGGREMAEW